MLLAIVKPDIFKRRTFKRAIKGKWLAVHSPNFNRWFLYSETIDRYMYRDYDTEEKANACIAYLKADIDKWQYPETCSANQWLPKHQDI